MIEWFNWQKVWKVWRIFNLPKVNITQMEKYWEFALKALSPSEKLMFCLQVWSHEEGSETRWQDRKVNMVKVQCVLLVKKQQVSKTWGLRLSKFCSLKSKVLQKFFRNPSKVQKLKVQKLKVRKSKVRKSPAEVWKSKVRMLKVQKSKVRKSKVWKSKSPKVEDVLWPSP